MGVKAASA